MATDKSEFRQLLQRYQEGKCSSAEAQRIEAWYRHLDTEQQFNLSPTEKKALMATVWQRISRQTAPGTEPLAALPGGWSSWPARVRWAAAAALILGAGLVGLQVTDVPAKWAVLAPPTATKPAVWKVYANTSARETQLALPDGSAVTLAPASTLRYRRGLDGRREAYLAGAAFFDVFHDKQHPFSVFTDKVVTTVLGTSFRVRAYAGPADVQVQVHTGAVRVSQRRAPAGVAVATVVVLPNQQAVYSAGGQRLRRELVAQPAQLTAQSFVFNDRPVAEVLAALEKAYGVRIEYDAAAVRNCTLNLSLGNEPLFTKLDIICETLGATYEKAGDHLRFHSPACQVE
ncbi:FecR family protein [Hymenobacter artigasi]|uniref:Ferric-dicitrate binding protein FerR (Iron transport regulator) n=1 Tax=Hymenobacter artigasi TaxID=2719616 RepID=A0ABX1HIY3_9BACT|nr:FecR family protein [Hymenobacter artigasi]NKI90155.1 ferric-dicitrate binding protein FerR (iron transport regulator) [Hymenobacter artigasi]